MSSKILEKVKYFIGIDDLEDEYIEDYEEEQALDLPSKKNINKTNKIFNIHTNTNIKLVVHEPNSYEDAPKIVDDLKTRKPVIINLEKIETEEKKQTFDFLNGCIYTLEGSIQKVAKDIFILAPNNVEIDGKLKEELKNKGLFPWQK